VTGRLFPSPEAFKQALEHRLRRVSTLASPLPRRRQRLVFDRFLARLTAVLGHAVILKGGLALELRLEHARSTKDIDLRVVGSPHDILSVLQEAARRDLGDYMTFEVSPDDGHPEIRMEGMRYDGFRFRAECKLAGKLYGQRFGVDVAFGDPILGEPDELTTRDVLAFAGIASPRLRLYPIETHIAEKLHAYTLPRLRPNSRVKDLPDLALLATVQPLEATRLTAAFTQTFGFRNTHAVPAALPDPPLAWRIPYAAMARDDRLAWLSLEAVAAAARQFLDPVLAGALDATWIPARWTWRRRGTGD
jgi:predicted nucleotidyltransferase component of viral defense system